MVLAAMSVGPGWAGLCMESQNILATCFTVRCAGCRGHKGGPGPVRRGLCTEDKDSQPGKRMSAEVPKNESRLLEPNLGRHSCRRTRSAEDMACSSSHLHVASEEQVHTWQRR